MTPAWTPTHHRRPSIRVKMKIVTASVIAAALLTAIVATSPPGAAAEEHPTGLERAARGNGKGNAWGRGHALDALSDIKAENHGQKVRELVHAYNGLRRDLGDG